MSLTCKGPNTQSAMEKSPMYSQRQSHSDIVLRAHLMRNRQEFILHLGHPLTRI